MEEIKNFVDNIHNEAYKNAYSAPLIGAESLITVSYTHLRAHET